MATWKKIIVSGSQAHLQNVTASAFLGTTNPGISFFGTASYAMTASFATNASALFKISGSTGTAEFNASSDTLLFTGSNGLAVTVTDNTLITTASFGFATDADVQLGSVTASFTGSLIGSLTGTSSWAIQAITSSLVSTTATATATDHYLVFVTNSTSTTAETLRVDSGIKYNPNSDTVTLDGDLAINGGDITTNQATFNLLAGATTTLNIGAATTTASIGGQVTIGGNLTVNGDITYINTTQLLVEDAFILVASGSANNADGGIIVDRGADASANIAFGYDATTRRWGYQNGLNDTATGIDPTSNSGVSGSFAGVVFTEASHGATKPVTGEFAVLGAIYTATNEDIWIYS